MELLLQSKSSYQKNFASKFCFALLSKIFETRSRLHKNFYIMGHPFDFFGPNLVKNGVLVRN